MTHLVSADLIGQNLIESIPAGVEIESGDPTAAVAELATLAGTEVGLWQMTPGVAHDVESDELFVVLSGHGVVEFDDGETIHLRPGVMVRLAAGERTRWIIHEALRKLYLAPR